MNKQEIEYKLKENKINFERYQDILKTTAIALSDIDDQKKELQAKLEEINKKPEFSWWVPKLGEDCVVDEYYYIDTATDGEDPLYKANCYEFNAYGLDLRDYDFEAWKARQRIQRTADKLHGFRYEFQKDQANYFIRIDRDLCIDANTTMKIHFVIYFELEETAKECLELCRKDFEFLAKGFDNGK